VMLCCAGVYGAVPAASAVLPGCTAVTRCAVCCAVLCPLPVAARRVLSPTSLLLSVLLCMQRLCVEHARLLLCLWPSELPAVSAAVLTAVCCSCEAQPSATAGAEHLLLG
jgi:hypothetical protein